MAVLFIGGSIAQNESYGTYVFVIGVVIITHLWFHLIYRIQEKSLINKVESELRLKEVKTVPNKAQRLGW